MRPSHSLQVAICMSANIAYNSFVHASGTLCDNAALLLDPAGADNPSGVFLCADDEEVGQLSDEEFDDIYDDLVLEHENGHCPDDCVFCEDARRTTPFIIQRESPKTDTLSVTHNWAKPAGEYVFTFGKHSGKPISQVPRHYLEWMRDNFQAGSDKRDQWRRDALQMVNDYIRGGKALFERKKPQPSKKAKKKKRRR